MCLIVKLPAGHRLTRDHVADTIKYNPDGVGAMYSRNGERIIRRTMASRPEKIIRFLSEIPDDVEYAVHFRRVTRGGRSIHNVHPFEINDRYAMMHNGTFEDTLAPVDTKKGASDTQYVVETHLAQMQPATLECDAFWSFFEAAVGYNRVLVLDSAQDTFRVINQVFWYENADGWLLSNNYAITDSKLWGVKVQTPTARYTRTSSYTGYASAPTPAPAQAPLPFPTSATQAGRSGGVVSYKWIDGIEKDYLSFRAPLYGHQTIGFLYPVSVKLAEFFPAECAEANELMTRSHAIKQYGLMSHCTATTILMAYLLAGENIMHARYSLMSKVEAIVEDFVRDLNGRYIGGKFIAADSEGVQLELLKTIGEEISKRKAQRAATHAAHTGLAAALLVAPATVDQTNDNQGD